MVNWLNKLKKLLADREKNQVSEVEDAMRRQPGASDLTRVVEDLGRTTRESLENLGIVSEDHRPQKCGTIRFSTEVDAERAADVIREWGYDADANGRQVLIYTTPNERLERLAKEQQWSIQWPEASLKP